MSTISKEEWKMLNDIRDKARELANAIKSANEVGGFFIKFSINDGVVDTFEVTRNVPVLIDEHEPRRH